VALIVIETENLWCVILLADRVRFGQGLVALRE
jgi:hypothetical protein